ncbi:MAG: hypothetical protein ACI8PZ_005580 [Myxococcota bacterium]|jgi:hypothetical protein
MARTSTRSPSFVRARPRRAGRSAADTEITASAAGTTGALPEAGTIDGSVFDFGPDGTAFSTPGLLTLPAGPSPGAGLAPVVSWLDGAAWVDLPTTDNGPASVAGLP